MCVVGVYVMCVYYYIACVFVCVCMHASVRVCGYVSVCAGKCGELVCLLGIIRIRLSVCHTFVRKIPSEPLNCMQANLV